MPELQWIFQDQAACKGSQAITALWETLPLTEKAQDEINFAALSPEVEIMQSLAQLYPDWTGLCNCR